MLVDDIQMALLRSQYQCNTAIGRFSIYGSTPLLRQVFDDSQLALISSRYQCSKTIGLSWAKLGWLVVCRPTAPGLARSMGLSLAEIGWPNGPAIIPAVVVVVVVVIVVVVIIIILLVIIIMVSYTWFLYTMFTRQINIR
jgi:hypothetical protein